MRIKKYHRVLLAIFFLLLGTSPAFVATNRALADEEDFDAEIQVKAPKGGSIERYENGYIEILRKTKFIKIYVYDKSLKPRKKMSDFSVTADALLPSVKDAAALNVVPAKGYFTTEFEAGAAPSFELDVGIVDHRNKSADRVRFSVETRKR